MHTLRESSLIREAKERRGSERGKEVEEEERMGWTGK
jgi:predicted transposase YdaD